MDDAVKAEMERLWDEDNRQNHRIAVLEESQKVIQELVISVHELAKDMKQMLQEQQEQGGRLDKLDGRLGALEREPARKWKRISDKTLDTTVGLVVGAIVTGIAFIVVQYIH